MDWSRVRVTHFPCIFCDISLSRTQKTHEKHKSFAIRGKKGVFVFFSKFLSRDKERVLFVSFTFQHQYFVVGKIKSDSIPVWMGRVINYEFLENTPSKARYSSETPNIVNCFSSWNYILCILKTWIVIRTKHKNLYEKVQFVYLGCFWLLKVVDCPFF